MGMGMGVNPQMTRAMMLAQAKGERETLQARIETTEESIRTLESSLPEPGMPGNPADPNFIVERMLTALIQTNLVQLKANLKEGRTRIAFLDQAIKQAESPVVHKATLIPGKL